MRLMVSFTARSLPGIGVAEKSTVSPSRSSTCGWSPWAIRRSADSGSPWLPVEITTSLWSGKSSTSRTPTSIPSGTWMCPSLRAMFTFLRIERPTSETLRPVAAAARDRLLEVRADHRLGEGHARAVHVGRVAAEQQQALAAELGEPGHVGGL